jgi:hypothetical protein
MFLSWKHAKIRSTNKSIKKLKVGVMEKGILIFMINSIIKLGNLFGYMKSFQRLDTKSDGEIDE